MAIMTNLRVPFQPVQMRTEEGYRSAVPLLDVLSGAPPGTRLLDAPSANIDLPLQLL
jgi:hypothetical protein